MEDRRNKSIEDSTLPSRSPSLCIFLVQNRPIVATRGRQAQRQEASFSLLRTRRLRGSICPIPGSGSTDPTRAPSSHYERLSSKMSHESPFSQAGLEIHTRAAFSQSTKLVDCFTASQVAQAFPRSRLLQQRLRRLDATPPTDVPIASPVAPSVRASPPADPFRSRRWDEPWMMRRSRNDRVNDCAAAWQLPLKPWRHDNSVASSRPLKPGNAF